MQPPARHRQGILILLDAARLDRFGYAGYSRDTTPTMDELGSNGLAFKNHYAHKTHTRGSLPNLFYSRYFTVSMFPWSDSVPFESPQDLMRRPDAEMVSIQTALGAAGFRTAAISAHSWLRPWTRFGREFEEVQDLPSELRRQAPPGEAVVDRAIDWISRHKDEDYFLYLHFMDTHFPHDSGKEAKAFFGAGTYSGPVTGEERPHYGSKALTGQDRAYMDALYDGSLRHVDQEIGRLVSYLREAELFEDTLIVMTSDHGEHLLEVPNRFSHGGPWHETLARIPLIISYPCRISPRPVVESFTETVDVAPTMLGLLGVPLPQGKAFDGMNLLPVAADATQGRDMVLSSRGIRTKTHKLLINRLAALKTAAPATYEDLSGSLYDLRHDPTEINDLWEQQPDKVMELWRIYREALIGPYRRFVGSVNHEQPESPFAISVNHFKSGVEFVNVGPGISRAEIRKVSRNTDWLKSEYPGYAWLLAREQAGPLDVRFIVPDGSYELTVVVGGHGSVEVPPGGPTTSLPPDPQRTGALHPVEVGAVTVTGERFEARIIPPGDGTWLKLTMLGFKPLGAIAPEGFSQEEHNARLRALGYID